MGSVDGLIVEGLTVGALLGAFVGGLLGARENGDGEIEGLVDGLEVEGLEDLDGDFVGIAVGCDAVIVTENDSEGIPFAITSRNPFPLGCFIGTVK